MAADDRVRWDENYRAAMGKPYPPPNPLLFEFTPPVQPDEGRRALDLACGRGQNGLWLAAQGYTVDLIDISRVALLRAQEEAGRRGLKHINLIPADLDTYEFEPDSYDLICVFRYLNRDLFPVLRAAVRAGGRILYETFNTRYQQVQPVEHVEYLLRAGELAGTFADWRIAANQDDGTLSRIVAIKPS